MEKVFLINGEEVRVQEYMLSGNAISFSLKGKKYQFELLSKNGPQLILQGDQKIKAAVGSLSKDGESIVMVLGREAKVSTGSKKMRKGAGLVGGLISPMPGKIFKIIKEVGSEVKKGEPILILEAMKMEHAIRSDKDGKVKKISAGIGELVQGGVILAEVE